MSKAKHITQTAGISLAVLVASLLAVSAASAHFSGGGKEQQQERVTELAERFNLDENEVETYFEEKRVEHQAEREEKRAEHMASLVEAGTLTQEQADELTAMREATRDQVKALRDSGAEREEIKTLMEEKHAEVEAWADAQGLSLDDIRPEHGRRHGHGHGHDDDSGVEDDSAES